MLRVPQGAPEGTQKETSEPRKLLKGPQENPKRHRRATKSTRSEAKRAPKSTQKEAKRAIESSKAKCVIPIPDDKHENLAPAQARVRFSMPEKKREANFFSLNFRSSGGSLGDPMGPPMRSENVDDDQFDLS